MALTLQSKSSRGHDMTAAVLALAIMMAVRLRHTIRQEKQP
jgi:hypothetical protein